MVVERALIQKRCGPRRSGKTTWLKRQIQAYRQDNPDAHIIFVACGRRIKQRWEMCFRDHIRTHYALFTSDASDTLAMHEHVRTMKQASNACRIAVFVDDVLYSSYIPEYRLWASMRYQVDQITLTHIGQYTYTQ